MLLRQEAWEAGKEAPELRECLYDTTRAIGVAGTPFVPHPARAIRVADRRSRHLFLSELFAWQIALLYHSVYTLSWIVCMQHAEINSLLRNLYLGSRVLLLISPDERGRRAGDWVLEGSVEGAWKSGYHPTLCPYEISGTGIGLG
eukprot:878240-Rhodomonas_salina.2